MHGFGQGAFTALSGGAVGGLASVAMGGSFNEGFKIGFISAGMSYAGNEIAGAIEAGGSAATAEGGDSSVSAGWQFTGYTVGFWFVTTKP